MLSPGFSCLYYFLDKTTLKITLYYELKKKKVWHKIIFFLNLVERTLFLAKPPFLEEKVLLEKQNTL